MKLRIDAVKLRNALKTIAPAQYKNKANPVLNCVYCDANDVATFTLTDLELTMTSSVECEVIENGIACIDYNQMLKISEVSKDTLEIFIDKTRAIINAQGRYTLSTANAKDYPKRQSPTYQKEITTYELQRAINTVSYASGDSDSKYVFTCINFKDNEVVATDGHRLAITSAELGFEALVNKKICSAIRRLNTDTASVFTDKNILGIKSGNLEILCQQTIGAFPNYHGVIPEYEKHIKIKRVELIDAIRSILIDTDTTDNSVFIEIDHDTMALSRESKMQGVYSQIAIACDGDMKKSICVSYEYLLDCLMSLDCDDVKMYCSEEEDVKPILISDDKSKHIIMPMRRG